MTGPSAHSTAAAVASVLAVLSSLHIGTLATVATVILIGFASSYVAHLVIRRDTIRQTRKIVDEAVKRHVAEMHAHSQEIIEEAAGDRPGRE